MKLEKFSKREQEIMSILFEQGESSVADVIDAMDSPPSYSAVRALMGILQEKGHLQVRKESRKYIYRPIAKKAQAGKNALSQVLRTFYEGSLSNAVAGILSSKDLDLDEKEFRKLSRLIDEFKVRAK